ncbi:unnamed protein product [Camellia sinensis]
MFLFEFFFLQMRPSLLVSFLLLSILISEVQGISLRKGFLPVGHHKIHKAKVNRTSSAVVGEAVDDCKDRHCLGTLKKRISRVLTKEFQHWLPKIHEDYYGPRTHNPKHH